MSDELRSGVVDAMETLWEDLTSGSHGDPHVAFTVLVFPDREPAVIALTPAGAVDLVRIPRSSGEPVGGPRFFTVAELDEARSAVDKAAMALRCARPTDIPGLLIAEWITQEWQRARAWPMERALAQAREAEARPAQCPSCKRRFTTRGLPAHLRKNKRCALRVHEAQAAAEATKS